MDVWTSDGGFFDEWEVWRGFGGLNEIFGIIGDFFKIKLKKKILELKF